MKVRHAFALFALTSIAFPQTPASQPPTAGRHPERKIIQSTKLVDDYGWLENGSNADVKAWVAQENAYSRAYLDGITSRKPIYDWLAKMDQETGVGYGSVQYQGGQIFALKYDPKVQQPVLVTLRSPSDVASERVVVDPNKLNAKGTTSIQFFVPSLDGKYVVVCLPEGGSENGGIRVFETATGRQLSDEVPRVQFATGGGSVAWNGDGSGFYYTRYPHEGERPAADRLLSVVYFHKLETPTSRDTYVIGKEFPRIAETTLLTSPDGQWVLATVEDGDGGQYEHFLRNPDGHWSQITHFEDGFTAIGFGPDQALYLDATKSALNGQIKRLPLDAKVPVDVADAKLVVAESKRTAIEAFGFTISGQFPAFVATKTKLYVVSTSGGPQEIRIFDHAGKDMGSVTLDSVSSVNKLVPLEGDSILVNWQTYVKPGGYSEFDPAKRSLQETALHLEKNVDYSDVEVVRATATSKDGAKVPFTVLRKKGTRLDGSNPTILTGYGGFGISSSPEWDPPPEALARPRRRLRHRQPARRRRVRRGVAPRRHAASTSRTSSTTSSPAPST